MKLIPMQMSAGSSVHSGMLLHADCLKVGNCDGDFGGGASVELLEHGESRNTSKLRSMTEPLMYSIIVKRMFLIVFRMFYFKNV